MESRSEIQSGARHGRREFLRAAGSVLAVGATVGAVGGARWMFSSPTPQAAARAAAGVKPTAANTGVPAGTALTVSDGDITVTTAGTVLQNLDIRGNVWVKANNVTIRNCFIRGVPVAPASGNYALVMQYNSSVTGLLIEDCTLLPQSPNQSTNGIQGSGMTIRRCDISNGVDGIDAMGIGNVLVDSCFIHDGGYFTPSNTHSDNQTHDDGGQITNGANVVYSNNSISGFYTSGLMIEQVQGPLPGLKIVNNWLDGGAATVNINAANYGRMSPVIAGNRFGRTRTRTYQILTIGAVDLSQMSGNVWDDNGQAVGIVSV